MQGAVWPALGLDERLAQFHSAYDVASGVSRRRYAWAPSALCRARRSCVDAFR